MLRRKERLSREAFNRFFSMGVRHHSPHFKMVYAPHPSFHASVVVPKKVVRAAVGRNKLRRRVYDLLRTYKKEHGNTGVYIVIAKPKSSGLSFSELQSEIKMLLGRTHKSR